MSNFYRGKVRDVYTFGDELVMITTDRISCFDVVLPQPIPNKGAILNCIAGHFLEATKDIVPNWLESMPHSNVMIGVKCKPVMIEMVIRGFLVGHAWREYRDGKRELCGVSLPENMKTYDEFKEPIITPTTKAYVGHDEDISKEEILERKLCTPEQYALMEKYTRALFKKGQEMAREKGLTLLDTKFEFGIAPDGTLMVIDEILTPDSSRYMLGDKPLSKEFVRDWLREQGFDGTGDALPPIMPESFIQEVSAKYKELYNIIVSPKKSYSTVGRFVVTSSPS
jgi:phosphoribosylaminoimidazole-succinocarboxamide synthase